MKQNNTSLQFFLFFAEYDPNPLLSLSKRKRRVSTCVSTEEKSQKTPITVSLPAHPIPQSSLQMISEKGDQESTTSNDSYKERKRLKKKKREKLRQKLLRQDKKKKKKHKCNDIENCKHRRHHKKHRKHKKHHEKNKAERMTVSLVINEDEHKELVEDEVEDDTLIDDAIETSDVQQYSSETIDEAYKDGIPDAEDEVTMDDIVEASKSKVIQKAVIYIFVLLTN